MKLHKLRIALLLTVLFFNSSAFAIDQVILKNGAIIEGKVLADVPNRHVDIQLVNGNKKRFQQTEVASVERDVPSNVDKSMSGSTSEFYFGPQLGLNFGLNTGGTSDFSWGARFGANATQLSDFAKLAFGLSFMHLQSTVSNVTGSDNQIMVQILFRKVGNTGFYFGPELGLDFASISVTGSSASITGTAFTFGADLGYDYYVSSGFSFGPDVRYEHIGSTTLTASTGGSLVTSGSDNLKALLTGTFHF